jgi:hypothetical protein
VKILKLKKGEALALRTCNPDGTSYKGFQWPRSGPVTCPDWQATAACGHGLHGLLWGEGEADHLQSGDAAWLVIRVLASEVIDIDRKVKFPKGVVEYFGDRAGAVALIQQYAPVGSKVVFGTATAGDRGTATAGYRGTTTAGYGGTATAGDGGTATAGYGGTATAGYRGTATAGDGGTATAGYGGAIAIFYWNGKKYRRAVFEVGENDIEAGVAYTVDENGKPSKAVTK